MLDRLDRFHNSKPGYAFFALFGLGVAYLFISYAIDSGSWFDYIIALLAIVVFLQNFNSLVRSFLNGKRHRR